MAGSSESTVVRIRLDHQNEERVIAENVLIEERAVTWLRAVMFALFGLSMRAGQLFGGQAQVFDIVQVGVIAAYLVFVVLAVVGMRRATADRGRAIGGAVMFNLTDVAFIAVMGIRAYDTRHDAHPEITAVAMGVVLCFSIGRYGWYHVALACALACGGFTVVSVHNRSWGVSSAFVIGGYVSLSLLLATLNRRTRKMFVDLRRRDTLTQFLPRQVAERAMRLGDTSLQPVQREVTVMFSDIRDFTRFSEHLPPTAVLQFLDEYFGHMSALVKGHDGIVNKFLGDGMLSVWGVPETDRRHAAKALRAALDMRTVVAELNDVRRQSNAPPIRIGIGVHSGLVAAGMLGGAEYTVIGDAVNVASRVEGLTKKCGVDILVSEPTWRLVGDEFIGSRHSEEEIEGRREPVVVYTLEGRAPVKPVA